MRIHSRVRSESRGGVRSTMESTKAQARGMLTSGADGIVIT